jgi:hypothetical protein
VTLNNTKRLALLGIVLIFVGLIIWEYSAEASIITVSQSTAFVGDTIQIEIGCDPDGSYIKGWEIPLLTFDPTILRVKDVTIGRFFSGYQQFFINGTIDNTNGTIINIYNLIVGKTGNVSASGQLCYVNFTALKEGNASINISKVGICNESIYLPFITINGSVNVLGEQEPDEPPEEPPVVPDVPPDVPVEPPVEEPDIPDAPPIELPADVPNDVPSKINYEPPIAYLIGIFVTIVMAVIICFVVLMVIEKAKWRR